MGKMLQTG